ncbi:MAG: hypothetical protein ACI87E_000710 [Mariniblastus sp.]|jgi:hypothetical protein
MMVLINIRLVDCQSKGFGWVRRLLKFCFDAALGDLASQFKRPPSAFDATTNIALKR